MSFSEFEDAYEDDLRAENAFLSLPIREIEPRPPVLIDESASVLTWISGAGSCNTLGFVFNTPSMTLSAALRSVS